MALEFDMFAIYCPHAMRKVSPGVARKCLLTATDSAGVEGHLTYSAASLIPIQISLQTSMINLWAVVCPSLKKIAMFCMDWPDAKHLRVSANFSAFANIVALVRDFIVRLGIRYGLMRWRRRSNRSLDIRTNLKCRVLS